MDRKCNDIQEEKFRPFSVEMKETGKRRDRAYEIATTFWGFKWENNSVFHLKFLDESL